MIRTSHYDKERETYLFEVFANYWMEMNREEERIGWPWSDVPAVVEQLKQFYHDYTVGDPATTGILIRHYTRWLARSSIIQPPNTLRIYTVLTGKTLKYAAANIREPDLHLTIYNDEQEVDFYILEDVEIVGVKNKCSLVIHKDSSTVVGVDSYAGKLINNLQKIVMADDWVLRSDAYTNIDKSSADMFTFDRFCMALAKEFEL